VSARTRWLALAPWAAVALAALLPYLGALGAGFVFDDQGLVLENPTVARTAPWWRSLSAGFWPDRFQSGLYRPITALSFRLQNGAGHGPAAFHAVNLLLHAAVCLVAYALLRRWATGRRGPALVAALVFAVHPLHAEAVTYVVGRAELLAALAGLGGYAVWRFGRGRGAPWTVGALFALAAGAKESALAWGLMLAAHRVGLFADGTGYQTLRGPGAPALRPALARDAGALAGFAAYLAARVGTLGSLLGLGSVSPVDNPIFDAPLGARLLTALGVAARGLGLVVWPQRLSADYSFDAIPVAEQPVGAAGLGALIVIAGLGLALALRRRAPWATWAACAWAALLLPVSNLVFPIGTIMAERLLYLPSLGAIVALVLGGHALLARLRWSRLAPWLAAALVVALAARTVARNRDWSDDRALFRAAVTTQPRSVKARANLGAILVRSGSAADRAEARRQYRAALAIAPDYLPALNGLGYALTLDRSYEAAREPLHRARDLRPEHPEAWVRLGNLELETGRADEALAAFEGALRAAPDLADAWIGKASALFLLARYDASAEAWIEAQRRAGDRMDLARHAAAALQRAGRMREAEAEWRGLAAARPGDPEPLRNLIGCLLARGDCDGARAVLTSAAVSALDPAQRGVLADSVAAACR
jgi:Flp pilus assembly protein TadD